MPSFDIVSEVNQVEINNAIDQANKEITNRFDFKGSDARIEYKEKEKEKILTLYADDEFKLSQVTRRHDRQARPSEASTSARSSTGMPKRYPATR